MATPEVVEPACPDCRNKVPICTSSMRGGWHWPRHTLTGNLTSGDAPECENSGKPWTGPVCPECGCPGEYGFNTSTFDRCPQCWWPGK